MTHSKTKQEINKHYDALIIGGGAVGTSLAVALVQQGFSVAMIDSLLPKDRADASKDNRIFALAAGTKVALDKLGLWHYMAEQAVPIAHIHVSNKGSFGASRLHAKEFDLAALGYMIKATDMQQGLNQAVIDLERQQLLDHYCAATLVSFTRLTHTVQATIELTESAGSAKPADGRIRLSANLMIGADGANSTVREQLGIKTQYRDFEQQALVALVQLTRPHDSVAYERFTADGAIALLPYKHNQCALIWSAPTTTVQAMMQLSDQAFLTELQQVFGYRLGRFVSLTQRFCYPLTEQRAQQVHDEQDNIVLIGSAAQTMHPIAAQGFNLALRHVALLSAILAKQLQAANLQSQLAAKHEQIAVASVKLCPVFKQVLSEYSQLQQSDTDNTLRFTHSLVRYFSNDNRLTQSKWLRGSLITAFDVLPPVKRYLLKGMMKGE